MNDLPPQQPEAAEKDPGAGFPDKPDNSHTQNGAPNSVKGQQSVLRTPKGELEFPGFVPGEVESPDVEIKKAVTMSAQAPDPPAIDTTVESQPKARRSISNTFSPINRVHSTGFASRPKATRQWHTELPEGQSQGWTRPSRPKDRSYLGKAMREGNEAYMRDHDGASASSSDSDSEVEDSAGPAGRPGDHRHTQRWRGNPVADKAAAAHGTGRFNVGNENYNTRGKVKKDGRLAITVQETANSGYIAKALGSAFHNFVSPPGQSGATQPLEKRLSTASTETPDISPKPSLNIVIMVIGSRGDIQPFLRIGGVLKEQGHRVRIATHPTFRSFVENDTGLEFFSVGGDPAELMSFMVKNPGMIPKLETVKAGDIGRRRAAMAEMFDGFWRACINATDDEHDSHNLKMMGEKNPFVADAIIANPPSFAHIHCAEALVSLMFP